MAVYFTLAKERIEAAELEPLTENLKFGLELKMRGDEIKGKKAENNKRILLFAEKIDASFALTTPVDSYLEYCCAVQKRIERKVTDIPRLISVLGAHFDRYVEISYSPSKLFIETLKSNLDPELKRCISETRKFSLSFSLEKVKG